MSVKPVPAWLQDPKNRAGFALVISVFSLLAAYGVPGLGGNLSPSVASEVKSFLARAGMGSKGEEISVKEIGSTLGELRPVLLYKRKDGLNTPGVMFAAPGYLFVGRVYEVGSGKEVSRSFFGPRPVTFDTKRIDFKEAHREGAKSPKVVIVEYGDYGCPACAELETAMKAILDNHPYVQRVFKSYPLSAGGRLLAEAAEAASFQGENYFWELHRLFFATDKPGWDKEMTEKWVFAEARKMGVDVERLKKDLSGGEPGKRVSRVQEEFPLSETPTLVVNGEVYVGALPYGKLKEIVTESFKKASARKG